MREISFYNTLIKDEGSKTALNPEDAAAANSRIKCAKTRGGGP